MKNKFDKSYSSQKYNLSLNRKEITLLWNCSIENRKLAWQNVQVGDKALVLSENKLGLVMKPYGRRFHLKFPDVYGYENYRIFS